MARLQSAMEYLMTYGWAILIIAVVLAALFGLGIFKNSNVVQRITAGSCYVSRPNGPGTSQGVNIEGECGNGLPEYVARFNRTAYITINDSGAPQVQSGAYTYTLVAWFSGDSNSLGGAIFGTSNEILGYSGLGNFVATPVPCITYTVPNFKSSSWYQVALVQAPGTATLYINGQAVSTNQICSDNVPVYEPMYIGSDAAGKAFNGSISNLQLYNTSLSPNSILALYEEGIGGDPIDVYHLLGWWPLNGNANDYSGNGGSGIPANVLYSPSWISYYTLP